MIIVGRTRCVASVAALIIAFRQGRIFCRAEIILVLAIIILDLDEDAVSLRYSDSFGIFFKLHWRLLRSISDMTLEEGTNDHDDVHVEHHRKKGKQLFLEPQPPLPQSVSPTFFSKHASVPPFFFSFSFFSLLLR